MGRHRRSAAPAKNKKRPVVPVRTGLLGASAAVAVGAVAIASGLLPGGSSFELNGGPTGEHVQAGGTSDLRQQGGEAVKPTSAAPSAPITSPSSHAPLTSPSATPSQKPSSAAPTPTREKTSAPAAAPKTATPSAHPSKAKVIPEQRQIKAPSAEQAAAATIVSLVNQQRAQAGCSPVKADASLAALATAFSDDMAARGFFDHTDPDGKSPWDRAAKAGSAIWAARTSPAARPTPRRSWRPG